MIDSDAIERVINRYSEEQFKKVLLSCIIELDMGEHIGLYEPNKDEVDTEEYLYWRSCGDDIKLEVEQ